MWGKAFVHLCMVVVEPSKFLFRHALYENGCCVYRTKRKWQEPKEFTELRFPIRHHEQCVFYAHAKASGEIQTGFVGNGHTGMDRCRSPFHAYLVWPLVHVEVAAHAVTCTMKIVQPLTPHVFACQGIELCACSAVGKLQQVELYVALQHEGVGQSLFVGNCSQRDGSRNVGRAVFVLCPAVEEQESSWFEGLVGLGSGFVMYDAPCS